LKNSKIKVGSNKSFGIVFFVVFLIISIWPLLDGNEIRYWSLIISVVFLLLGIINSKILTPLNKIWFKFGIFLGNFVSPIIMGIVFFLVVTPISLILRLLGKDILNLKKNNKFLLKAINKLKKNNIRVSLFIEPKISDVFSAKKLGANCVEFHTGKFCNLLNENKNIKKALFNLKKASLTFLN